MSCGQRMRIKGPAGALRGTQWQPYTTHTYSRCTPVLPAGGVTLGNLVKSGELAPPLERHTLICVWLYDRAPKKQRDTAAWCRRQLLAEAAHPTQHMVISVSDIHAGLAPWLRGHRHLKPIAGEHGETSMALLIPWEVDHGQPFPSTAGGCESALVPGFTHQLQHQVEHDDELTAWLVHKDFSTPPGLLTLHCTWWAVQIVPDKLRE